jgi:CRP/FNR family transcriptional regulator, cyclic AMP receptor protein
VPMTPNPSPSTGATRGRDPWHLESTALDRLSPAVRERLDAISRRAEFGAGEIVMRDGAPTPFLGVVEVGRVGLRLHVPERGPQTIVTIERGELLGWSAVVPPYRATAEAAALEPTRILAIEAEPLRALLEADRDVALELLPTVLDGLSQRLVISWQQLLDLYAAASPQPW